MSQKDEDEVCNYCATTGNQLFEQLKWLDISKLAQPMQLGVWGKTHWKKDFVP